MIVNREVTLHGNFHFRVCAVVGVPRDPFPPARWVLPKHDPGIPPRPRETTAVG